MIKKKRFLKILTSLVALSLVLCSLFTLTACTTYTSELEENYKIGYSEFKKDAFIIEYRWRGHLGEDMDIVLPNTYKDLPVTTLGGYIGTGYPCPFVINFFEESDLDNELFGELRRSDTMCSFGTNTQEKVYDSVKSDLEYLGIAKEFEIKDIVFNLHIGSNLQKFEDVHGLTAKYLSFADNEEEEIITVYAFSFIVTVDEQNEYFYSDDLGRMYYKESNNLVDFFLYHNRDSFPEHSLPTI